jgi:hypothetical protein
MGADNQAAKLIEPRQIGSASEQRKRRRRWTRIAPEIDAYTIAISLGAGFIDEWPIELTRDGARALRRGDVIAEAERRIKQ